MTKIVIFDLNGTLALNEHRQHYINHRMSSLWKSYPRLDKEWKADWKAFYDACDDDLPNIPVIEIARLFRSENYVVNYEIVIITGRENITKLDMEARTRRWLKKHKVPFDRLLMRQEGDYRADDVVKMEIFLKHFKVGDVLCVFDDRKRVVKMWRELGLKCFQVAEGDF